MDIDTPEIPEEDIEWEDESSDEKPEWIIYPIDRDKIKVTVNNWTIFWLIEYLKRGKLELQPVFQRSYVWDNKRASNLIDSIWNWLPIPQVFLLSKENGKSLVIDWQQRLTSIARFMLSEENCKDYLKNITIIDGWDIKLKVPKKIFYPTALSGEFVSYEELTDEIKDKFESESIIVAQINPTYSLFNGDIRAINDISKEIFNRLNTGWVQLSPQEIRQSLYSGKFMQELQKISFDIEWKNLLPVNVRKINRNPSLSTEILLRALAFLDAYGTNKINDFTYFKPLESFLDRYAELANSFSDEDATKRMQILNNSISFLNSLENLGHSTFKHTISGDPSNSLKSIFNIKYIDTLLVGIMSYISENPSFDASELAKLVLKFKSDWDFIKKYVTVSWGWDITYTSERVEAGIAYFRKK